jgi:serine/threonine protein kinase
LKNIHLKGVIHRDIKPDNFVIGKDANSHLVYIIDFGLGKFYKDLDNGKHINHRYGKGLIGTARYASINAFLGIELSRRDDLESLAYTLIYLAHGSLPWMYIPAKSKLEKHQKILKMKQNFSPKDLINEIPSKKI